MTNYGEFYFACEDIVDNLGTNDNLRISLSNFTELCKNNDIVKSAIMALPTYPLPDLADLKQTYAFMHKLSLDNRPWLMFNILTSQYADKILTEHDDKRFMMQSILDFARALKSNF